MEGVVEYLKQGLANHELVSKTRDVILNFITIVDQSPEFWFTSEIIDS